MARIPFPPGLEKLGITPSTENARDHKLSRFHQAYRGNLELNDVRRRQSTPCAACRREGAAAGALCRHRANGQKRFYLTNLVAIGLEYGVHGHYPKGRIQTVHRGRIAATNGVCESTVSRQMGEVSRAGAITRKRSMAEPNRYDFVFAGIREAWCVLDRQHNDAYVSHAFSEDKADKQARGQNRQHKTTDRYFVQWQEMPDGVGRLPTLKEIEGNEKLARLYDSVEIWKKFGTRTTPSLARERVRGIDGYAHIPKWWLLLLNRPAYKAVLVVYLLRGLAQMNNGRLQDRIQMTQDQVAYAAGVSVRTVRRTNAALERTGLFRIVAHRGIQRDKSTGAVVKSEPQTVIYLPLEKANHEAIQLRARVNRMHARIGAQRVEWRATLERLMREAGVAESADLALLESNCAAFRKNAVDAGIPATVVEDTLARPPG